jgi:hypothetical protein
MVFRKTGYGHVDRIYLAKEDAGGCFRELGKRTIGFYNTRLVHKHSYVELVDPARNCTSAYPY